MYSSGDVVYIMAADAYIPTFGLSEGPLSYACFFSLHTNTRVYNFFPHRDYYYTVVRIYTYSVYIHTETAMSLSSGERGRGRHKNTYVYIRIRRGELARRSIKGWSRGNSYSVQYSQWMISALTWLL